MISIVKYYKQKVCVTMKMKMIYTSCGYIKILQRRLNLIKIDWQRNKIIFREYTQFLKISDIGNRVFLCKSAFFFNVIRMKIICNCGYGNSCGQTYVRTNFKMVG